MNEEEIIKRAKKDKKYFEILYSEFYPKIFSYIFGFVNNKENTEDLTSLTFEKAFKGIDNFQWEGISISSWLYKIARNTVNDYYRKSSNRNPAYSINQKINESDETFEDTLKSKDEHIEEQIIKSEEENELYQIFMNFDENDQYLIYYKYFEGLNNKEIGKILGISETNVGTRAQRIREKMKKLLYENKKSF